MVRFAKVFFRLFRAAIILLPLLIAFRGYVFLRECFRMLAAPGTGIDFTYQARKGALLRITAQSYNFLWESGTLHVIQPRLQDVNGSLLANAASARISGLQLGGNDAIDAVVRDFNGRLVRLKNGHFALEEYLPEQTPQTQNRPYRVRIDGANVVYEDLSGSGHFEQRAMSNELMVEGLGQDWVASGQLAMPGVGTADAAVQRYKDSGLLISLNAQTLDLTNALNHFRTTPEGRDLVALKNVTASKLIAQGPVRLYVPDKKPWLMAASLNAHGTNVVYGGTDRFNSAEFNGLVTGSGATGTLALTRGGGSAKFVGATDWTQGARFAGTVTASVAAKTDIPVSIAKFIPSNLSFSDARGQGWLSYDKGDGIRYDGSVQAARLVAGGQSIKSADGLVRAGSGLVRVEGASGVWQGSPLTGSLTYYPTGQRILGQVAGSKVELASVAKAAHIQGLSGSGDAVALLSGTVSAPLASFRASGNIAFQATGTSKPLKGTFEGAGSYASSGLDLTDLSVNTPTGTAAVTGHANPNGRLALKVAARGISLEAFSPSLTGTGSFSGDVSGTAANPNLQGKAQILGLTVYQRPIPLVLANLDFNKKGLIATDIQAVRGAAQASGSLSYGLGNGSLTGSFSAVNLPVSELSDQLSGIVSVPKATLGGTVKNPAIDASLETHGLIVAGRPIGKGRATVTLRGNDLKIPEMRADVAGGTIAASGTGNLKSKEARVELSGTNVSLSDLAPELNKTASIDGKVAGVAVVTTSGAQVRYAKASGNLSDVELNQTLVGNGSWTAGVDPKGFSGSAQIGTLERYLDLSNLAVDREAKSISADFTAYHIPLQDIYSAVQRYIPPPSSDVESRLLRVEGIFDAQASISGPLQEPDLTVNTLDLTGLNLEGRDLGAINTKFTKKGPLWTVAQLNWQGPAGVLQSSGVVDENGDVKYDGDLTNVDLSLLSIANDSLTRVSGRAGLSFAVSGPTRSPVVQASLDASRTSLATDPTSQAKQLEFGMVLDTINISESTARADGTLAGGIEASGKLFYRGFEGNLTAQLPLKYPLTLPQGEPLSIALDLPQRELSTLSDYLPGIDLTRTKGNVAGHLALTGPVGDAKLNGQVTAQASTFALKKVQTSLTDATAKATVDSDNVSLNFDATSSQGGTVSANAKAPIGDVSDRIKELSSRGVQALLDRTVDGGLTLHNFGIKYDGGDNGRLVATANANITAAGPLRAPQVTGTASMSGVNTLLPSWDVTTASAPEYVIDPRFNVKLDLTDTATIATSLARLRMIGNGALTGSLNAPAVTSDLTVMGGTIKLPTSSVRIDPGGTVKLRYRTDPSGDTMASLVVDLVGRTSLTTAAYGDIPQHYDITLNVKGDLLQEGQTFVSAESEPPGLGQDRILALLGQADLIAALAGSATKFEASKDLRNALAGYAVPALLSPITNAFAKGLGLDYLNVEYGNLSQVYLSFSKDVSRTLSLQGTRQISEALPGSKQQYDLRLVYRLPFKGKALRNVSFNIGTDQDRPWKVGLQYGFRF